MGARVRAFSSSCGRIALILLAITVTSAHAAPPPDELMRAVIRGDRAGIESYLSKPGANINDTSVGHTALMLAVTDDMVEYLIAHGADVNVAAKEGNAARTYACANVFTNQVPLFRILLAHGADFRTSQSDGLSPLHCTAFRNKDALAEFLMDHGAEVLVRQLRGVGSRCTARGEQQDGG